ncbi:hypothetical protein [Psychroserpens sp. SPM9]|uniref:hypothetical protein n=1 Tax=Psychroserpens sp. SPM9 TaxID=2975598 RepID=UPI0021A7EC7E|nr:hypothetical protein [Psychroserpens sp. SPM9]MDG5490897.1 hypothetical protein [Psychroserpens sp. SPM9]
MKTLLKLIMLSFFVSLSSCENEEITSENALDREPKDEKSLCETAYAYGKKDEAICFLDDDDLNSNKWGWTIGPISAYHNQSYPIYQAAGGCNLDNGEEIGTLTIVYESDYVLVDFVAHEGYGFFETHLFVGNEKYPRKRNGQFTVAPGQYTEGHNISDGALDDSYKIDDVDGDIYVIAHAVVCPFKKDEKF